MASNPVETLKKALEDKADGIPAISERVALFKAAIKDAVPDCRDQVNIPNAIFEDDWDEDEPAQNENFLRQILQSYRDTKGTPWEQMLACSTPKQRGMLEQFVDGKALDDIYEGFDFDSTRGTRKELMEMRKARTERIASVGGSGGGIVTRLAKFFSSCFLGNERVDVGVYEDVQKTKPVEAYIDAPFSNWGETVLNKPQYTFVPTTGLGVQGIVKFAKNKGLGVRVAGYRHSWTSIFARARNCVLISMLDLNTASDEINTESLAAVSTKLFGEPSTKLNDITTVGRLKDKTLVRVGCATTNEQLRRWCIRNRKVTLPFNIIMVEITAGGGNAPICHGAGITHQTLSDLVHAIEYVDAKGDLQTITADDGDFLKAASGCFGLIGVVTHLVLKFDKMSYAIMTPMKVDVIDAIPPPEDMRSLVPQALRGDRTDEQIRVAQKRFEENVGYYYAEWFWFPYSDQVWINCWQNQEIADDDDGDDVEEFPSKKKIVQQWLEGAAIEAIQDLAKDTRTEGFLAMLRTSLVSRLAMSSLPGDGDKNPIKAWLPDAMHFRRAVQNTRVRDMEMEIPIPHLPNDRTKPDFSIIQRAWWDAIITAYEHGDKCPQRMPLELRITGDSQVTLAPFRGNAMGTASIEILTLLEVADIWQPYAQKVLDKWMALREREEWKGQHLNIRPSWAKEWSPYRVDGKPFLDHAKENCYKNEIPEFNKIIASIGKKHGWTRKDIQARFSNELLDQLFFDDMISASVAKP